MKLSCMELSQFFSRFQNRFCNRLQIALATHSLTETSLQSHTEGEGDGADGEALVEGG